MQKFRIIGNMTGNSMDAIDLVLTEFVGDKMSDVCSFTRPFEKDMQNKMQLLRNSAYNKTGSEIIALPEFKAIHDEYVGKIGECINEMCKINGLDKQNIDAIGFHGKTLDHNPPSKALKDGSLAYTLQIGSGKMLADLTGLKVVYDFRSDLIMSGFDGAPLAPQHNAHIAYSEGDGVYYNGGNTSNFAVIRDKKALLGTDAGPFNEYIDGYVRKYTNLPYDENAQIGSNGELNIELLQKLYDTGRVFYETSLPKSGDPAYYHQQDIFDYAAKNNISLADTVHTFEYFAAYIAVQALTLLPENIVLPHRFILFGGGWKNPLVRQNFTELLNGKGRVFGYHQKQFADLLKRFKQAPEVVNSAFGDYMEARLFADLARYKLQEKAWEIPEVWQKGKRVVCGLVATPEQNRQIYDDMLSRAAKGWQNV